MAKRWGLTVRTVQIMCADGKIGGVTKFGNAWAIPINAENLQITEWFLGNIKTGENNMKR